MPGKSPRKSRNAPFTGKSDPRNGRGPKKGAPNAGRPPDQLRALAAAGLEPFIRRCLQIINGRNADLAIKAGHALVRISGLDRLDITGMAGGVFPKMRVVIEHEEPLLNAPLRERVAAIKAMLAREEGRASAADAEGTVGQGGGTASLPAGPPKRRPGTA